MSGSAIRLTHDRYNFGRVNLAQVGGAHHGDLFDMIIQKLLAAVVTAVAIISTPALAGDAPETYDAELAEELGADEFGMRPYVLVILKTGPAEITDEARRNELFAGHMANIGRLAEEGKLVLAGPFMDGGDKRGLFIFNVASLEEAEDLVTTDPAVEAGLFTADMTKYYGSAALLKLGDIHKKIQKRSVQ